MFDIVIVFTSLVDLGISNIPDWLVRAGGAAVALTSNQESNGLASRCREGLALQIKEKRQACRDSGSAIGKGAARWVCVGQTGKHSVVEAAPWLENRHNVLCIAVGAGLCKQIAAGATIVTML